MLECSYLDLITLLQTDVSTQQVMELLLRELSALLAAETVHVSRSQLEKWIYEYLGRPNVGDLEGTSMLRRNVAAGKFAITDDALTMAWVIERCHLCGIHCPTHEELLDVLVKKSEQYRIENDEFLWQSGRK